MLTDQQLQSLRNSGDEGQDATDEIASLRKERDDLRLIALRALRAWDSTVLPKAHDGMMQESMEDLRAELAKAAP